MVDRQSVLDAAKRLPPQERASLVMEIWDSLAAEPESVKLTQAQEVELDRCWREYLASPRAGDDWATTKARILGKWR